MERVAPSLVVARSLASPLPISWILPLREPTAAGRHLGSQNLLREGSAVGIAHSDNGFGVQGIDPRREIESCRMDNETKKSSSSASQQQVGRGQGRKIIEPRHFNTRLDELNRQNRDGACGIPNSGVLAGFVRHAVRPLAWSDSVLGQDCDNCCLNWAASDLDLSIRMNINIHFAANAKFRKVNSRFNRK